MLTSMSCLMARPTLYGRWEEGDNKIVIEHDVQINERLDKPAPTNIKANALADCEALS